MPTNGRTGLASGTAAAARPNEADAARQLNHRHPQRQADQPHPEGAKGRRRRCGRRAHRRQGRGRHPRRHDDGPVQGCPTVPCGAMMPVNRKNQEGTRQSDGGTESLPRAAVVRHPRRRHLRHTLRTQARHVPHYMTPTPARETRDNRTTPTRRSAAPAHAGADQPLARWRSESVNLVYQVRCRPFRRIDAGRAPPGLAPSRRLTILSRWPGR